MARMKLSEEAVKDLMDKGESAFAQEYREEIKSIAEDIRKRVREGDLEDSDAARTAVEEFLDGHSYVIYTSYNYWVLLTSDNDDAMAREIGVEANFKTDWWQLMGQMTYHAMLADVMEELGDLDILFCSEEEDSDNSENSESQESAGA